MMLNPSSEQQPRISQFLPTVKCSDCNQPVPVAELGEHICATPPPVPPIPKTTPSPTLERNAARSLSARAASPALPTILPPQSPPRFATPPLRSSSQTPHVPAPFSSSLNDRPPSNTPSSVPSHLQRLSPLARPEHVRNETSASKDFPARTTSLRPALPSSPRPPTLHADPRLRSQSNIGPPTLSSSTPRAPYPGMSIYPPSPGPSRSPPLASSLPRMASPAISYIPGNEAGIDTKSGGEAGMAGVGRRGFAAAMRAAMFIAPVGFSGDAARRAHPPRFVDTDVASHPTDTPPLSAGSGYSSHSPGPLSPVPQPETIAQLANSPTPDNRRHLASDHLPLPMRSSIEEFNSATGLSPLARIPSFEKLEDQAPANTVGSEFTPGPRPPVASANDPHSPPRTAKSIVRETMSSVYSSDSPLMRNLSISTSHSTVRKQDRPTSTSDSGSECGLAYADETDDEGDQSRSKDRPDGSLISTPRTAEPSSEKDHTGDVRFPSDDDQAGISPAMTKTLHNRDQSLSSSYSSDRDSMASDTSGSEAIARALGLSRAQPSEYGRLGGPGVSGIPGRKRSVSHSSMDSRSTYSRVASVAFMAGTTMKGLPERPMETLKEDVANEDFLTRSGSPSLSTNGNQRVLGDGHSNRHLGSDGLTNGGVNVKAHRSNTVQVPLSPENKPPKLPARANTTATGMDHNKSMLDSQARDTLPKKLKVRKTRICLRCEKRIEDGRWVQVDSGGALCEKCWKNMYLPKCRRCNLPIERQAVSSADGQLKGKYHRECFDCHVCHKPFPDKIFYVYGGKPLCAYHYHEANDSLCAAARCGQPIEGPCAVSHTGDKYHPEHFTCEYPGYTPCGERLTEYWEVDGRMLCEKHAAKASREQDDGEEWVQSSKAMKRVTRFIDLTGAGGNNESLESGLR